jgi:hypothetical protein
MQCQNGQVFRFCDHWGGWPVLCESGQFPASSKEADLERNVLTALDSVPLVVMWRSVSPLSFQCSSHNLFNISHSFATRAHRIVDAYAKGLQGKGAAWAAKKYRGHRVLPESILAEFDNLDKAGKA